jgi:hypothetical protein
MRSKILLQFSVFALILSFAFVGCKKYEEGPTLSLRTKRDRITNLWKFENVTYDGQDVTSQFNRADYIITFDVLKAGFYTFTLRDKDGSALSRVGGDDSPFRKAEKELSGNLPVFRDEVANGGKWSFTSDFSSIQMFPELSQKEDENKVPVFTINQLRADKFKISRDAQGSLKKLEITFTPLF